MRQHYIGYKLQYVTMTQTIPPQVYEQMIVLDSCVVIEALKNPLVAKKIVALFRGKHSRIVLQDIVLNEAQKITGLSKEEVLRRISLILHKEAYVFVTSEQMRIEAQRIEQKYGICHYPDSLILASCKISSWTLISYDRNILRSAEFEGILAFNPSRIGRF